MYLGRFLIRMGLVSQRDVDRAVAIQRDSHLRLGERAVLRGYLTEAQVRLILHHQQSDERMFGEIAQALDLLSAEQLASLQAEQQQARVQLGSALVSSGALSPDQLASALQSYERYRSERSRQIADEIAGTPHAQVLNALVGSTRLLLPRFGVAECKVAEVRMAPRATPGIEWSAFAGMSGSYRVPFGLGVSTLVAETIRTAAARASQANAPSTCGEAMSLFVRSVAHHARAAMPGDRVGVNAVVADAGDGFQFMEALIAERYFTQLRLELSIRGQPIAPGVLTVATLRDNA